ncbi:MAG: DNA translocase FtsK 4TM domain-containing protein, partial [Verrucomicrobia bacterium]|nr:DNA translocase FtsK 4TM domain-containing protein [Verrucomicrobiota bacterium]
MPRSRRQNPWNEVIGLVALGIGTVVFLALISYNPGDVPSWVWFSYKSPPNNPTQNFIGPTGAIVAGFLYLTLGAAAYLVTSLFLGFGVAKLFLPGFRILRRLPWALLFVVSGAALTQLQPWFLRSWEQQFKLLGPGGMLGYWVGAGLLQNALGKIGSIVALICIYLVSLVWLTGIRPVAIVKQIFSGMRALARQAATDREQKRLAAADERERLELDQRKIEREIKKQERELKKKGVSIPEEPAVPRPEPKVFDTVAAPSPPKKPSRPAPPPKPAEEVYELPGVDLFDPVEPESRKASDPAELKEIQAVLVDTLKQFNIDVAPGDITRGPTITRYEVYPARGVRVDRITSLERDLARATRAERINILAPIPGKDTVGIEIANTKKVKVALREIVESSDWAQTKMKIPIVLGKDVYGKIILGDLAQMPHCLVAGTTGSGKSVCINAVIASILLRFSPADLQFVMIDPKVVEMQMYNSLPHLKIPVVTDPKKVLLALRWVVSEMEKRYRIFAHVGVRNVSGFNARPKPKTQKELDLAAESGRDGQTRPNVPDGTRNARDE